MTKRITTKYKIDRRYGINLWGRSKSPINKRNYGPGQHGQNRSKPSDYGLQLRAKQILKGYYGNMTEKQFRRFYQIAAKKKGDTAELLIGLLETRLDTIVYRMKLAPTVFCARQLVNHGHVLVNGKKVNIASATVKVEDTVSLSASMHDNPIVMDAIESSERDIPDYINFDAKLKSATFVRVPSFSEVPYPVQMHPHLVIEFYSR
jgi:small subunit ribosomal protein S4